MPHRNNRALHPNARAVLYQIHQHHALGAVRPRELKQWTGLSLTQVGVSLRALRKRGLVVNPSHGRWAAVIRPIDTAWIAQAAAQCDTATKSLGGGDPVAVDLMLAKHHLLAALERARA